LDILARRAFPRILRTRYAFSIASTDLDSCTMLFAVKFQLGVLDRIDSKRDTPSTEVGMRVPICGLFGGLKGQRYSFASLGRFRGRMPSIRQSATASDFHRSVLAARIVVERMQGESSTSAIHHTFNIHRLSESVDKLQNKSLSRETRPCSKI
jgi:hypothetical protein